MCFLLVLCSYLFRARSARVDAHGQAWGDRFVVFGGAMFKKGKSEHQSAMEDVQNPMEAKAFTEYGLYDLLKQYDLHA